jgi:hypothetical protein
VVTSDGHILARNDGDYGHNDYIGPIGTLEANWRQLLNATDLTAAECWEAEELSTGRRAAGRPDGDCCKVWIEDDSRPPDRRGTVGRASVHKQEPIQRLEQTKREGKKLQASSPPKDDTSTRCPRPQFTHTLPALTDRVGLNMLPQLSRRPVTDQWP